MKIGLESYRFSGGCGLGIVAQTNANKSAERKFRPASVPLHTNAERHDGRDRENRGCSAQREPGAEVAASGGVQTTLDWPQCITLRRHMGQDGSRRIEKFESEMDPSPIL